MKDTISLRDLRNTVKAVGNYSGLYLSDKLLRDISDRLVRGYTIEFNAYPAFCKPVMDLFLELLYTEKPDWDKVKYIENLNAERYGSQVKTTIHDLIKEVNND